MSKTGASQLLYQQYFWLTKLLFMMQPTGSQTLIAQLPSVLTGKLSHILPFALLTARCDGREAAGTGGHRCYRSPCRGRDRAVPRRGQRAAPGRAWQCCPPHSALGASLPEGSPSPEQRPPPPRPLPGILSAEPRHPQRGLRPCPHDRDCPARKRRG